MGKLGIVPLKRIQEYQAETFCPAKVKSKEEAIAFVNQRGFAFFWPIQGIVLPSLWVAVAGDRPVPTEHDDPGHVTWGWKDSLLGARRWYYAKVLRKRATMISLDTVHYFYALSENYGAPEDDYLTQYEQGRLTLESRLVYEALLYEGPLDTVALRRVTHLTSKDSDSRFNRALLELQGDFKILPVGVAQAGAWRYAFAYDLVSRHHPDLVDRARFIQEGAARQKLVEIYFRSVGAAQIGDLVKLFGWSPAVARKTVDSLVEAGVLRSELAVESQGADWIALEDLI